MAEDKNKKGEEEGPIRTGSLFAACGILIGTIYWLGFDGIAEIFTLFFLITVLPIIMMCCAIFAIYEPFRGTVKKFLNTFIDGVFNKLDEMEAKVETKKAEKKAS